MTSIRAELLALIEEVRQELYEVAKGKKLFDEEVVLVSQKLDSILNIYNSLDDIIMALAAIA